MLMPDPWRPAETEMRQQGYNMDRIPAVEHQAHLWADGLLLFWTRNKRLPTPHELCVDMMDEWDDPVNLDQAYRVLKMLEGGE